MGPVRDIDHLAHSLLNFYVFGELDRAVAARQDSARLHALFSDPSTCLIPFWKDRCIVEATPGDRPIKLHPGAFAEGSVDTQTTTLLGIFEGGAYFAAQLTRDPTDPGGIAHCRLEDLRHLSLRLEPRDAALLAYAKAMMHWHDHHRYCGKCGARTKSRRGGHVRLCENPSCEKWHFPRTDPAIIVAVTRDDRCLLARQATWPARRYSVIAGFVEPGESVEHAVAREVSEETGLRIDQMRYHSSQPWPFPGNMMLGYTATTRDVDIALHDNELEHARWFSRREVKHAVADGSLRLPPTISIAYRLIEDWFDRPGDKLSSLNKYERD